MEADVADGGIGLKVGGFVPAWNAPAVVAVAFFLPTVKQRGD